MVTAKGKAQLQDFTAKAEKDVYPLGTKNININVSNNTNLDAEYGGSYYQVDKFENNEWHSLDFAEDAAFVEIAECLSAKGKNIDSYNLSKLKCFNKLTAGRYRVLIEIDNSLDYSHVTAEFELQ